MKYLDKVIIDHYLNLFFIKVQENKADYPTKNFKDPSDFAI